MIKVLASIRKRISTGSVCGGLGAAKFGVEIFVLGIAFLCAAGMPTLAFAQSYGLAHEWEPDNELKSYKKNYLLLYAVSSQPNNLPTSPNPANQVLVPYALDNRDIKFQVSVKHALADFQEFGSFWLGYTQQVLWQYYDKTNSRPIREASYEPEFIYSLRPNDLTILNLGAVHQSNGEPNPRSRSWNRIYIQPGMQIGDGEARLEVLARWWQRVKEDPLFDENPDITAYLGYREFEVRYLEEGNWEISVISRIRSTQLDIAAPFTSWFGLGPPEEHHLNVHVHYFNGYGESLLDYNQAHTSWGVGISFPFDN